MSEPTRDELRVWTRNLGPEPLDVGDPAEHRYVPLAEAGRGAVEGLRATIELSFEPEEHAGFLRAVAAADGAFQPRADQVQLMARMVQSQMLLGHVNGENWYEVHPLARRALELP